MTDLLKPNNERKAEMAFSVHAALMKAEAADPSLKSNPYWQTLKAEAYGDFCRAYVRPK